ncbi:dihydroxyacetone kinase subunit DhaK [Variovorax sp. LjRoot290]|uniref:dihydroxyacetone kinase subunit DhaK n=1 Tax=unclassified Variovorax TaxID=663243 RepID=UPI003ECE5C25
MKKFINYVDDAVVESLSGLASAHEALLAVEFDPTFVCRRVPKKDAVAVVSGGGSGHEPLHTGYVGRGMLDAACPGQVFTSPTPDQWMAAAHRVNAGRGVLFIVKNYAGDRLNFQMASDMLVDLDHLMVVVDDDVAIDHSTHGSGRRGVAGTVIVEKIVGAAAEAGADLFDCKALGDRINSCTASMGVAFNSCIVPASGVATFEIGEQEMELGVGIHGEPGRQRMPFAPAVEIVDLLLDPILKDLSLARGREVLLHVNGLGGTPLMELYLLQHHARRRLAAEGLTVARTLVGNHTTSLEMAGASLTVTALDDEAKRLWDAPVHTPTLHW